MGTDGHGEGETTYFTDPASPKGYGRTGWLSILIVTVIEKMAEELWF